MTSPRKWSQDVTENSDALDLEPGVFERKDPAAIARSLKESAERSKRRKGSPLQSSMSMLTFYINRAGDTLDKRQRKVLEAAKDELRLAFGRPAKGS
jgi:putative cell wall-binding protein